MEKSSLDKFWFLKNLDIYEGISEAVLCRIASSAYETTVPTGTQIYSPHKEDGNIYVLKRGEVVLYHSKDGKRAIFDTLEPGSVFGSFDPQNLTPTHFAVTTRPTMLCVTPLNEFLKIISEHPEAMLRLMQKMALRIHDYEQKIQNSTEGATERIYNELERIQKKRQQSFLGKFLPIPLQITHETLAEHTNLNRVTVTRGLQQLKNEGLIRIESGTGVIHLAKV